MSEPSREPPECGPQRGRVLSGVLALALPAERREEFWGDLLEEAHQRQQAGRGWTGLWVWLEVLRSLPWLFGRRLQRAVFESPAPMVGAISGAKGEGAFAAFLGGPRARGIRHPLSMGLSLALHGGLLVAGLAWTFWRVDEVEPPRISVVLDLPRLPDAQAGAFDRPKPAPKPPQKKPPRKMPTPAIVASDPTPEAAAVERTDTDGPDGDGSDRGQQGSDGPSAGPCAGLGCSGGSRALPAEVGQRRCVSCPPPRLPPALVRLGIAREMLVRICVDPTGRVSKVVVLRGLGGSFDADAVKVIRRWRFAPLYLGDHPVPFCFPTRFVYKLQ